MTTKSTDVRCSNCLFWQRSRKSSEIYRNRIDGTCYEGYGLKHINSKCGLIDKEPKRFKNVIHR